MARTHRGVLILLVVLAMLLAGLQAHLWLGEGGRRAVEALEAQVAGLERENGGLRQRNDALAAEVEDLKSGEAAVEERARSELGMIRPGEVFYRVVDREATAGTPAAPAPSP